MGKDRPPKSELWIMFIRLVGKTKRGAAIKLLKPLKKAGLPGDVISFHIVPRLGQDGSLAGQHTCLFLKNFFN